MSYAGPYGSVAGVQSFVRHIPFDGLNAPTTLDVETWLIQRSAQLTAWIAAAGYVVPVIQADAKSVLDRFANVGATCDVELSMRSSGYDAGDENKRENKFCTDFATAQAWIAGDALEGLGVGQTGSDPASTLTFVRATYGLPTSADEYTRPGQY